MGSPIFMSEGGVAHLLADLEALLENLEDADAIFYVGPSEIPIRCHSFVLKCRCKAFRGGEQKLFTKRCPEISPELFHTFLGYLYTGKLKVDENRIFELLCLANEFGIEDLELICEDFLCRNLEPSSACALLESALLIKKKLRPSWGKGLQRLIDQCVAFIGENPTDCLQTLRCLSFSVDTLSEIIASDQLCLEEEDVWRFVLRWAQYQADVGNQVSRWSEDERQKVAHFLAPVISNVRLLLIDSKVFAEEIEPTGCVPMALSLERYRFAALPNQFGKGDPRLTPRNTPRLFQSSTIIRNDRISLGRKLNEWYGGSTKQSWKCVYRASIHGYGADDFHDRCSGVFPTYVLILLHDTKWICGGFSDVPWTRSSSPRYATSNKAFLFRYDASSIFSKSPPLKFKIVKKHFAICHASNGGPIFGAGADLFISSNCNVNSESYSNLPHSYESEDGGIEFPLESLTPSYNFTVADYEVFTPIMDENE